MVGILSDLAGYGTVWLNHEAIANILSLKLVQEKYHIAYDHEQDGGFVVTKQNVENLILYSPNKASIIWTLHFQVHVNQMKSMVLQQTQWLGITRNIPRMIRAMLCMVESFRLQWDIQVQLILSNC